MGRSVPSAEPSAGISFLGLLLFVAVAAVVGFLCGTRHQRRSAPPPPSPSTKPETRRRRLSMSLSMKFPDGLWKKDEGSKKVGPTEEKEETLWMKAIILGDKCKIPEEEEEDEDAFVRESRQRSYRPRTPRSLPVSRFNSFSEEAG